MLVVMMTSVAFTGCVSDDDDDSTTDTIIEVIIDGKTFDISQDKVSHENYSWTE